MTSSEVITCYKHAKHNVMKISIAIIFIQLTIVEQNRTFDHIW